MRNLKLSLTTLLVTLLFVAYGCQQESVLDTTADLPYLSLPENTDFNNLSDDEMQIVMSAFDRINISEDELGLFRLKQIAGWEVAISENIYQFIKGSLENANNKIVSDVCISRSTQLNNSETPGEYQTDCLARAIAAALGQKGSADINAWITERYGNDGVPPESVNEVLKYFSNNRVAKLDYNQIPNNSVLGDKYIIILNDSHAVNGFGISNGYITYKDYQLNDMFTVPTSNISDIYYFY
ncbi:MAG: hypothetical protein NC127_06750 [Muribaculum sp.]|nr:hypothetical protein [Muribaculum sp.]